MMTIDEMILHYNNKIKLCKQVVEWLEKLKEFQERWESIDRQLYNGIKADVEELIKEGEDEANADTELV